MSRLTIAALAGVLALAGCSTHEREPVSTCCEQAEVSAAVPPAAPRLASGLIFDRRPGMYTAEDFAWRSDWPSTLGYYRAPEAILYRQRFTDFQGPGWSSYNYAYRQFDMQIQGQAVR